LFLSELDSAEFCRNKGSILEIDSQYTIQYIYSTVLIERESKLALL